MNPEIVESRGEWAYDEGCLSIPGLAFELVRPKEVHLKGYDLDGNELSIEADELLARAFQHEMDHLDGVLFIERLDDDTRKAAMKIIREQRLTAADLADADLAAPAARGGGFSLRAEPAADRREPRTAAAGTDPAGRLPGHAGARRPTAARSRRRRRRRRAGRVAARSAARAGERRWCRRR